MRPRDSLRVVSGARAFGLAGVIACSAAAVACGWIGGLGDPQPAPDAGVDAAGTCADQTPAVDGVFVAPSGTGACTRSAPCGSISEAIQVLASDSSKSTIYVAAGDYNGSLTIK